MGVARQHTVSCTSCGSTFSAPLAESVNVTRFPQHREQILAGTFHRVCCTECGARATVERAFSYIDIGRQTVFSVKPRSERHLWEAASAELDIDLAKIPDQVIAAQSRHTRVVFGMGELREKLVAQDAGLDDRDVEMLKALVVYDHPFLLQRPRLRLSFTEATPTEYQFTAAYDHDRRVYRASMPRSVADPLLGEGGTLQQWAASAQKKGNVYSSGTGHWVNMWSWSPRTWALAMLGRYAATLRAGGNITLGAAGLKKMLLNLPRGSQLPAWAKIALRSLFEYARTHNGSAALLDDLFEIRFARELEDDWTNQGNSAVVATLWDLLKDLPDTNVEGNVKLNEIFLDVGTGGGFYEPWSGDIHIGGNSLTNTERFQDVMRHEVGHAVHESNKSMVDTWLGNRFGWRSYAPNAAGIDAWVGEMGGWGSLSTLQRNEVRQFLIAALGAGSTFASGPAPNAPANHVWWSNGFGPRLAFQNSGTNWWQNNANWFRVGNRAFVMNFWYRSFIAVDVTTLNLVGQMPSSYASMSHMEFFAEMYALHYDLDDPLRGNVPLDVANWLNANIGPAVVGQPSPVGMPSGDGAPVEQYAPTDIAQPAKSAKRAKPAKSATQAKAAKSAKSAATPPA